MKRINERVYIFNGWKRRFIFFLKIHAVSLCFIIRIKDAGLFGLIGKPSSNEVSSESHVDLLLWSSKHP